MVMTNPLILSSPYSTCSIHPIDHSTSFISLWIIMCFLRSYNVFHCTPIDLMFTTQLLKLLTYLQYLSPCSPISCYAIIDPFLHTPLHHRLCFIAQKYRIRDSCSIQHISLRPYCILTTIIFKSYGEQRQKSLLSSSLRFRRKEIESIHSFRFIACQ